MTRFGVYQDLTIDDVARRERTVRIDVSDPQGKRDWIRFRFEDADEALVQAERIAHWMRDQIRVTYVRGPESGRLLDDREQFRRSYEDDAAV